MNGNKIIAALVVLAMVVSTLVVLNINLVEKATATAPVTPLTPGVRAWGNATTELIYGVSYSAVYINTSKWSGSGPFYLYYPTYRADTNGYANEFSWDGPFKIAGNSVRITSTGSNNVTLDTASSPITFNKSGMWIFDNDDTHAGNDVASYAGYIWVNASTTYTIESVSDFNYGDTTSLTITVDTGTDTGCIIDIMNPNNATIYHKWRATGVTEQIKKEPANFSLAGTYTVKAYRGMNDVNTTYYYPDENGQNYSTKYGSDYTAHFPTHPVQTSEHYNYTKVGPWNPPEKNATAITFTVNTGEPIITLTNTSIYWGYKARIDVNVTDSNGKGIVKPIYDIKLKFGSKYVDFSDYITNLGLGNYSIDIPRYTEGDAWTDLAAAVGHNVNGTWKIVFGYDANNDGTYEWNGTASFHILSVSPPVQLIIVNDGSGRPNDKKVNVPAYTPDEGVAPTLDIVFDIFGRSITDDLGRAYYGDNMVTEDWKNITVTGDILYPVNENTLVYNNDHANPGRWTASVTTTKPGGTINITVDWPGSDNGTASQTIEIVNGTNVASNVDRFTVGADYNLTITVKDMDQAVVKNAHVYLMWQDEAFEFNDTVGDNTAGNGMNGEYTFWIRPHKKDATTPNSAPQNITVAVQLYPTSAFWGYTKVIMDRDHNMMVNVTPTTGYAGDPSLYNITIALVGGGHPTASGLTIALYNSTGTRVTGDDAWSITNHYSIINEEIILSGGTYYLYAYNASHDSGGHNATIIVSPYTVTSSPSILAWKIDQSVNMTFHLMPAGNGTLTLNNMTSLPNASYPGESNQIAIDNGVGTLDEVNATTLGNVTFDFAPDSGQVRDADGLLRITTATATPNPATIYIGEVSTITITVTHPGTGTPLEDIRVGLDHGLSLNETILERLPNDQFTDSTGKVHFGVIALASGIVTISIENETDPNNAFVIVATTRRTMTIITDSSVNEGNTFTVQAKYNNVLITGTTVTFTFASQTWPTTTGVATLTAPSVTTSTLYTIYATAEGYTSPTTTITVLNVPTGGEGDGGGSGGNQPPTAEAGGPYSGHTNQSIAFNGSRSTDDSAVVGFRWDWKNDGTYDTDWSTTVTATHAYATAGTYTVKLQVKDSAGLTGTDTAAVIVTVTPIQHQAPVADAGGPYSGLTFQTIHFDGTGSHGIDGSIVNYTWSFGDGTHGYNISPLHIYDSAGTFTVTLTVKDSNNLQDNATSTATILLDANRNNISDIMEQTIGANITHSDIHPIQFNNATYNLVDTNGDGIYDTMYNPTTNTKSNLGQQNGKQLIDVNNDGIWDYVYDPALGTTTPYVKETTTGGFPWMVIAIIAVVLVIIGLIVWLFKTGHL